MSSRCNLEPQSQRTSPKSYPKNKQSLHEARLSSWTIKCTSPSSFNARLHIAVTTSDGPSLSATITQLRPWSLSAYTSRCAAGTKHNTSTGSMESSIRSVLLQWSGLPADLIALTVVTRTGGLAFSSSLARLLGPSSGLEELLFFVAPSLMHLGSGTGWAELVVGANSWQSMLLVSKS